MCDDLTVWRARGEFGGEVYVEAETRRMAEAKSFQELNTVSGVVLVYEDEQ
jgi:hypothetical protein